MTAPGGLWSGWPAILVATAGAVVLGVATAPRALRERSSDLAVLVFAVVAAAVVVSKDAPAAWIVERVLVADPFATFFQFVLALVAAAVAWLGASPDDRTPARGRSAVAVPALAVALVGFHAMVAATAAWTLWAGFEVSGLAVAIALATGGGEGRRAAAASLLRGALASALLLAGFSLIAGLTGATDYGSIAQRLVLASSMPGGRAAVTTALVLVGSALAGRLLVVAWASWPAGEAARLSPAMGAWILVGGALAAVAALGRLLGSVALAPGSADAAPWTSVLAVVALATAVVGGLGMLRESRPGRLFAWIAVLQSAYLWMGLAAASVTGLAAALFQSVVHAVTLLGLAAVLHALPLREGLDDLGAIRGLARRGGHDAPVAMVLLGLLLSSAGVPPLAGYAGRARLFSAAVESGSWLLGTAIVVASAIGGLGALRVAALLLDGGAGASERTLAGRAGGDADRSRSDALALAALLLAATVAIGVAPSGLAAFAARSVVFFGG